MRFLRQSLTGLFLAAATLALLMYAGKMIGSAIQVRLSDTPVIEAPRERVFAVNVLTATAQTLTPVLTAFGEVQSRRTLEIRAATGGRIVELADAFQEGGDVKAGQSLIRIDPADAQSALDRITSDLRDAEAEVRDAARGLDLARDDKTAAEAQAILRDRALQRQIDLQERGVGTAAAVEIAELAASSARQAVVSRRQAVAQAEARVDQAATRLSRAGIALAEAERRLDDTVVVAEFDGTLADVSVVRGGLVAANEKLASLVDGKALEVSFRVSTSQYSRLLDESGELLLAPVTVTLDVASIDLTARAHIERDSAVAGNGQTGRLIFARLDEAPGFKPGDFVTVSVQEPALDNVYLLPSSAVNAASNVLVLVGEDRLESLPVVVLRRQGDDVIVRAEELEGREVVESRSPLLGAGIAVRPLRGDEGRAIEEQAMLELSAERRAKLVAFVQASTQMPAEAKARILAQLEKSQVPQQMVERIESRMGG
ncbi:Multidrug resistance protein MdtA (plasmid) [Pseudoseohaeicola sp. NH-UV-7]|uniref:efflux RND transporter periplasmic adaptor subunit n=1 Tax=Sulfitobacter sp. TBRI5 TaxID=2989732 RepID=UPI003A733139